MMAQLFEIFAKLPHAKVGGIAVLVAVRETVDVWVLVLVRVDVVVRVGVFDLVGVFVLVLVRVVVGVFTGTHTPINVGTV